MGIAKKVERGGHAHSIEPAPSAHGGDDPNRHTNNYLEEQRCQAKLCGDWHTRTKHIQDFAATLRKRNPQVEMQQVIQEIAVLLIPGEVEMIEVIELRDTRRRTFRLTEQFHGCSRGDISKDKGDKSYPE